MTTLLRSKCALTPDLLQLQRLPVLGAVTAFRAALPVRCEASDGYLSRSTSVAFAQTFVTQRVERAIPFIRLIFPEQVAGTAGHPS